MDKPIVFSGTENLTSRFANGEIAVKLPVSVKNRAVVIMQSTSSPVNDHIMELLLVIDAAKRSGAKNITAVVPFFGYSRQDRTNDEGVPNSSELMADLILTAGAIKIISVDIHTANKFIENVSAAQILADEVKKLNIKDIAVASPDKNGVARAKDLAKLLNITEIAVVDKIRDKNIKNVSRAIGMTGNVENKNVILVDDMIDTAGTIVNAAQLLKKHGAKKIIAVATHGIFSDPALTRLATPTIDKIIITDSIQQKPEVVNNPNFQICPIAPLFVQIINQ
jgi:ribose-phosphate pyrophosphokinase